MKTSKIILISFFVLMVSLMAVATVKLFQPQENNTAKDLVTKTQALPDFNYLKIAKDCKVSLINSEDSAFYFSCSAKADSLVKFPTYEMLGDTLYVTSTPDGKRAVIRVAPNAIKFYRVSGELYLRSRQDSLVVAMQGGKCYVYDDHNRYFNLKATGAHIQHSGTGLQMLSAELNKSRLNILKTHVDSAVLVAHKQSRIYGESIKQLTLSMDPSSTIKMGKQR